MADDDKSLYNLRYNQMENRFEGFGGGTPQWTPLSSGGGGGTPGGNTNDVQFNLGGAFAGSSDFTWDGTFLTATNLKTGQINDNGGSLTIQVDGGDLTANTSAGVIRLNSDGNFIVTTESGSHSLIFDQGRLTTSTDGIWTSLVHNPASGANLEIAETQGATINIHNENGAGGSIFITADTALGLTSTNADIQLNAANSIILDNTGGKQLTWSGFTLGSNGALNLASTQTIALQPGNTGENVKFMRSDGVTPAFGMDTDNSSFRLYSRDDGYGDITINGNGTYLLATSLADGTIYRIVANNLTNMVIGTDQNIPIHIQTGNGSQNWDFNTDGSFSGSTIAASSSVKSDNYSNSGGSQLIDGVNRYLLGSGGVFEIAWNAHLLAHAGSWSVHWGDDNIGGDTSRRLMSSGSVKALDWTNRTLNNDSGTTVANWSGTAIPSSVFTLTSTTQGFLPPRMSSTQRDSISSPATGLEIYNTTTNKPQVYNGTTWVDMVSGGGGSSSGPDGAIQTSDGAGGFTNLDGRFDFSSGSVAVNALSAFVEIPAYLLKEDGSTTAELHKNPSGGSLELINNDGAVFVESNSGPIALQADGYVSLENGDGSFVKSTGESLNIAAGGFPTLSFQDLSEDEKGYLQADCSTGDMEMRADSAMRLIAVNGNLSIESTGGDTVFNNPSGNLRTDTVSGNINLTAGDEVNLTSTTAMRLTSGGQGVTVTNGTAGLVVGTNNGDAQAFIYRDTDHATLGLNDSKYLSLNVTGANGTVAISDDETDNEPSAMLSVHSTSKGFLPPAMTTTQRDAIATPANGLEIYNTTLNEPNYYNGTAWVSVIDAITSTSITPNIYVTGEGNNTYSTLNVRNPVGGNPAIQMDTTGAFARNKITVVDYTALAGATIVINGTETYTEGSEWTAATSNNDTAASIRSAIGSSSFVYNDSDYDQAPSPDVTVWAYYEGSYGNAITITTSDPTNLPLAYSSTNLVNGGNAEITSYFDSTANQTNSAAITCYDQSGGDQRTVAIRKVQNNTVTGVRVDSCSPAFFGRNQGNDSVFTADPVNHNVRMGDNVAAVPSALLQVDTTTQGFLPPRMTTTQRDAISSPAAGLMIYNTTTNKMNFYNGSAWRQFDDSAA